MRFTPKSVDMRRSLLILTVLFSAVTVYAQQFSAIKIKDPVVCYAATKDHPHYIEPPQKYLDKLKNPAARTNATNIIVNYVGFDNNLEAKQCFQKAIDIWAAVLNTSVPIRIEVRWTSLASNVLGSANYTYAYANFKGAQKLNVYYPVAIAEKITGQEMNGSDPDIIANFNGAFDWHYDPNSAPLANKYDLTTVVLHEMGHGLGFSGTMTISNNNGFYGLSGAYPIIYDVPIETGSNVNVIESNSSAAELANIFRSQSLFFDAPSGLSKLYAPAVFNGGSSISHLDEATFNGTSNALMTPQIAPQEQMLNPGLSLQMLGDLGWETILIGHTKLGDTENTNGPYTVTATIKADNGYDNTSVKLYYSTNGINFTSVDMTATGQTHTFSGNIPGDGNAHTFRYYTAVKNTTNIEYVNPGKFVNPKSIQTQGVYSFSVGPDTQAPVIKHTPLAFVLDSDTELNIQAVITDNSGELTATLEYFINNVEQPSLTLPLIEPTADSVYRYVMNVGALSNGDVLKYRIVAVDHSAGANRSTSPSGTNNYYTATVVGLEPTQDSYANNFNSPSSDFFGSGFFIITPSGFTDGAIHSNHPYEEGNGHVSNQINTTYQLKIPIRVKATDALIKFDEIVLVEPGEPGAQFGQEDFYDYVVVEGSKDGGINWTTVANGYDAQSNTAWLTRYTSSISGNNSTGTGDPALYKSRTLDLQNVFDTNDEVVIRFRLFSDRFAVGWGWAIDNLRIQVDETPPLILHDHFDFITKGTEEITLVSKVSDAGGVASYAIEVYVNDDEHETISIPVNDLISEYEFKAEHLDQLVNGDVIHYRFIAGDVKGNVSTFPSNGFINVTVLEPGAPVTEYTNDFNSATTDFIGNFFGIATPSGFSNGAIHSDHPYATGMGLNSKSNFSYILTKPVTIAASNSFIYFKEIVLVEGHTSLAVFGTEAFNDYVIVEGSADNGHTWTKFEDGYDAVGVTPWENAINSNTSGTPALLRSRSINMRSSGAFEAGDQVLIRFRLFSNATSNKWGWTIDDLSIQSMITGVESELEKTTAIYPNPTKGQFTVEATGQSGPDFTVEIINLQGQKLYEAHERGVNGKMVHTISAPPFAAGMYIVKIKNGNDSVIRKIMRTN